MRTPSLTLLVLAGLVHSGFDSATANPVGEIVRGGAATFNRGGNSLTIFQSTPRLTLDWQDFSIGAGQITRFVQPSARSIALNRVSSGNPSLLYGSLQANGRVLLLNPNGILVGPNGVINTHSFMGSTLDGSDERLLKGGRLTLAGDSQAPIKNEGSISALGGSVYLIAHTVENSGSIHAPHGQVGLAAGSEVILHDTKGAVGVVAGRTSGSQAGTGVNNSGLIDAASAQLQAAGGNVYALAINNSGIVRANSLVRENGRILLKATGGNIRNSGTLSAQAANGQGGSIVLDAGHQATAPATAVNSGAIEARGDSGSGRGGHVQITGDDVQLASSSRIDVSGGAGGGTVLVGGDAHGNNPAVQNAQTTTVADGAVIRADALQRGDGGKVVVLADDATSVHGSISARGGLQGGDGGSVETSGKRTLDIGGSSVTADAPRGRAGHWLLDPTDYVIDLVQAAGIQTSLEGGTDVEVATSSVGVQLGDLTVAAAINKTAGTFATLTLTAHHDIDVQQPITLLNGGLTLNAGNDIKGAGPLTVDGNTHLNAIGNVTATLGGGSINGPVSLQGKDVTLTSDGPTLLDGSTISGKLSLQSKGDISQSGPLNVAGDTELTITDPTDSHSIVLGAANNLQGKVSLLGTRVLDLSLRNAVGPKLGSELDLGASSFRDVSLTFDSGDALLPSIIASGTVSLTTGLGDMNQAAGSHLEALILQAYAASGYNINLQNNNIIEHLGDISGFAVRLNVSGAIDQVTGTSISTGGFPTGTELGFLNLRAGGSIRLDQDNHLRGRVDLATTTPLAAFIRNAQNLTLGQVTVGDLTIRAQGNVDQTGDPLTARTLTANVTGSLVLEGRVNSIETLGNIDVGGRFSLYDSSITRGTYTVQKVPALPGPGITQKEVGVTWTPDLAGDKTLGLRVNGAVRGSSVTIRTLGDLLIDTTATLTSTAGDVILSAETLGVGPDRLPVSADFHYNPITKVITTTGGRYVIYSTTAATDSPVQNPDSQQMEFGTAGHGLQPGQTADPFTFGFLPAKYDGLNLFVFSQPQNLTVTSESAKFVLEVLRIKPLAPLTFSQDVSKLPPTEAETMFTSSYHVYAEEAELKKKGKHKRMASLGIEPPTLAFQWEPVR